MTEGGGGPEPRLARDQLGSGSGGRQQAERMEESGLTERLAPMAERVPVGFTQLAEAAVHLAHVPAEQVRHVVDRWMAVEAGEDEAHRFVQSNEVGGGAQAREIIRARRSKTESQAPQDREDGSDGGWSVWTREIVCCLGESGSVLLAKTIGDEPTRDGSAIDRGIPGHEKVATARTCVGFCAGLCDVRNDPRRSIDERPVLALLEACSAREENGHLGPREPVNEGTPSLEEAEIGGDVLGRKCAHPEARKSHVDRGEPGRGLGGERGRRVERRARAPTRERASECATVHQHVAQVIEG